MFGVYKAGKDIAGGGRRLVLRGSTQVDSTTVLERCERAARGAGRGARAGTGGLPRGLCHISESQVCQAQGSPFIPGRWGTRNGF